MDRRVFCVGMVLTELKSFYQLDVLNSANANVVEALVLASMLSLVVSWRLLNFMRQLIPEMNKRWTPLRWAEAFTVSAPTLMARVLRAA
ncbi:MAG: hypothetical protein H5U01_07900, partial [Clostridia bacterium]|nr:hypothetical protein [Clostridia bacterium]